MSDERPHIEKTPLPPGLPTFPNWPPKVGKPPKDLLGGELLCSADGHPLFLIAVDARGDWWLIEEFWRV